MAKKTLNVTLRVKVDYKTLEDLKTAKRAMRNRMYLVGYGGGNYRIEKPTKIKITE